MSQPYHIPVLLYEVIEHLRIQSDGIYVDCTYGGGGHSKAILEKLNSRGIIVAFDQDEDARRNLPDDPRIVYVPNNFRHLQRFLRLHNLTKVDGILADLGVSSHQFDEEHRGFSTRFNADLDMRMNQRGQITAFHVIQTYSEQELHKLFEQYGEVTNAKTLARKIVEVRSTSSLKTTDAFRNAVRSIVKGNPNKYFAQVFQALRIAVNDEMEALKEMLQQIPDVLKIHGRVVIITFHSIEDRLVKNFFRRGTFEEPKENPFENIVSENKLKLITKKPIVPVENEIKLNPRSRSAKMRVAERIAEDGE